MKIFVKSDKLLWGVITFCLCFLWIVFADDSWQERACVNEYKTACNVVSKNFTEPYCITYDENSRDFAFECVKLSSVNKFSPSGNKTKLSDFTLRDILNNYCSLLYNSDWTRVYFAKSNGQTDGWAWNQTFDSHQSLFLYALCSSFKESWEKSFLWWKEIKFQEVFSWNLVKLLKLQQFSESWKDFCSLDDYSSLDDCDMSIYATKIYEAIMTDLFKIKYAQVLDVNTVENFEITEKVKDFMSGYNLSDKDYKELKKLYPKTLSILESNQIFYKNVLGSIKIIDNSMLATQTQKTKCPVTWNMTWIDFAACALHSSQWNKFALTPAFVTLLYNEILHYRMFLTYYQKWAEAKWYDSRVSDFEWYSQKQFAATEKVQHDFENFNMSYPLHIWLLMYTEKVESFRNTRLSKLITSFYSLSEKLQNVQEPN